MVLRFTPLRPASPVPSTAAALARPLRGWITASAPLALLLAAPGAHAQGQTNPFGLTSVGTTVRPTFGDLDGDGDLDLIVCTAGLPGPYRYHTNIGTALAPDFDAAQDNPFGLPGCDGQPIDLADLDADGDLDLIAGRGDGSFDYYENTGSATEPAFGAVQLDPFGLATNGGSSAPTLADFDGDGDFDLLSGSKVSTLNYYENTGTAAEPAFAISTTDPFGLVFPFTPDAYTQPAAGDYDGDGLVDVLIGAQNGSISLYRNTGTATVPAYNPATVESPPGGVTAQAAGSRPAPAFGDLNGGTPDVFVGLNSGNFVFFGNPALPVELVAFTARLDGEAAVLRWETASETANAGFHVERLRSDGRFADGVETLGFVAGHGTTSETHRYTFRTERLSTGTHRFRLRQIDVDGTATLVPAVEVHVGTDGSYAFTQPMPSPTRGASRLSLSVARAQAVTVAVYDALGRRMATLHDGLLGADDARTFEIDTRGWAAGTYHVVATGERFRADRRLVVAR